MKLEYLDNLIKWKLSRSTGERVTLEDRLSGSDDVYAWQLVNYIDVLINQVEMNTALIDKLIEKLGYTKFCGYASGLDPTKCIEGRDYKKDPVTDYDLKWELVCQLIPNDKIDEYIYIYDTENLNGAQPHV